MDARENISRAWTKLGAHRSEDGIKPSECDKDKKEETAIEKVTRPHLRRAPGGGGEKGYRGGA